MRKFSALFLFLVLAPLLAQEKPFERGVRLFKEGDYKGALESFREALKEKEDAIVRYNIASALYRLGEFEESSKEYRRALEIKPDYEAALFGLACALTASGKTKEAIDALCSISTAKQMKEIFQQLAMLSQQSKNEVAEEAFLTLLSSLSPDDVQIKIRLSEVKLRLGDPNGSLSLLKCVVKAAPENSSAHLLSALSLHKLNCIKEAIDEAEIAFSLGEKRALKILAQLYIEQGLLRVAAKHLLMFAEQSGERNYILDSARLYLKSDAPEDALNALSLLPSDSETSESLSLAATALNQMRRFDEALSKIKKALHLEESLSIRLLYAQILIDAGRLDEAETEYRTILTEEPSNPTALRKLATIFKQTGRQKEAEAILKQLSPPSELKR
ncbi:MAG: tetratricopeptide repeat protein [Planctomycetota bacterium]|nr:tetratricopeptide repeat protein [Planctomycetota bacterium]